MDVIFFQKYDIITVQTIAKKDIDLLKNQVINGSVQTWKVTWIYWKKFWIFYVLVSGEREREREREETMGLRNWEIILEEMRIKMGDEVKTFEPNCYVNKSSPCNGISCLWEGKKSQSHIQKGRLQCLNCSNSFPTKWLSSIGHILNWLSH